jgi:hypothetical protein
MKSVITTERSLIAAFVISDIASFLLLLMNIFNNMPGDREVVPIFLMIIPAIYLETKRRLKTEESRGFHYNFNSILIINSKFTKKNQKQNK